MEVYFIRHGHALHNQGFDDMGEIAYFSPEFMYSTLTEKGHAQTRSIVAPTVDAVISSPLVRCIQTARNVFGPTRLLYLHDGLLENQGEHPCNTREPKQDIVNKYEHVNVSGVRTVYNPILETEADMRLRAEDAIRDILRSAVKNNYTRIAVVSHHNWLYALLNVSMRNAEVYRMYYSPEQIGKCID
jgi:broad specificity phosphatase PhoE